MDLNEIVDLAKAYIEFSGDHKFWLEEGEMIALINAGAKVIVSHQQYNGTYLTEAIYKNVCFTHTNRNPLISTNPIIH